ncbi:MAG: hypothetical protein PF501_19765 [Salinisphaera sp.]|nr:hypothetical protein [Salinisphaera sp.]
MGQIGKSVVAAFIATVVLSLAMIIKAFSHLLPAFNAIELIHGITGGPLIMGWVGHFVIGTLVWGTLFALFYALLPGRGALAKGLAFSVAAWLAMMVLFMPVAGAGFFGLAIGAPVILAALVLHLIWGVVLGLSYARLTTR